jgi:tubulin-specific chaperone D
MRIWSILTNCLDDYTVDSRGDVGSWIRMAACESLVPVFKHTSQQDVRLTMGKLLRLSVEKMDKVRIVGGRTLCDLIPQWIDAEDSLKEFVAGYAVSPFRL